MEWQRLTRLVLTLPTNKSGKGHMVIRARPESMDRVRHFDPTCPWKDALLLATICPDLSRCVGGGGVFHSSDTIAATA